MTPMSALSLAPSSSAEMTTAASTFRLATITGRNPKTGLVPSGQLLAPAKPYQSSLVKGRKPFGSCIAFSFVTPSIQYRGRRGKAAPRYLSGGGLWVMEEVTQATDHRPIIQASKGGGSG